MRLILILAYSSRVASLNSLCVPYAKINQICKCIWCCLIGFFEECDGESSSALQITDVWWESY